MNPTMILRIRTYKETPWVDVWIEQRQGAVRQGLMHGRMFSEAAEHVADATKLEVEREYYDDTPINQTIEVNNVEKGQLLF